MVKYEDMKAMLKEYIINGISDSGDLDSTDRARANGILTALFVTMQDLDVDGYMKILSINLNED